MGVGWTSNTKRRSKDYREHITGQWRVNLFFFLYVSVHSLILPWLPVILQVSGLSYYGMGFVMACVSLATLVSVKVVLVFVSSTRNGAVRRFSLFLLLVSSLAMYIIAIAVLPTGKIYHQCSSSGNVIDDVHHQTGFMSTTDGVSSAGISSITRQPTTLSKHPSTNNEQPSTPDKNPSITSEQPSSLGKQTAPQGSGPGHIISLLSTTPPSLEISHTLPWKPSTGRATTTTSRPSKSVSTSTVTVTSVQSHSQPPPPPPPPLRPRPVPKTTTPKTLWTRTSAPTTSTYVRETIRPHLPVSLVYPSDSSEDKSSASRVPSIQPDFSTFWEKPFLTDAGENDQRETEESHSNYNHKEESRRLHHITATSSVGNRPSSSQEKHHVSSSSRPQNNLRKQENIRTRIHTLHENIRNGKSQYNQPLQTPMNINAEQRAEIFPQGMDVNDVNIASDQTSGELEYDLHSNFQPYPKQDKEFNYDTAGIIRNGETVPGRRLRRNAEHKHNEKKRDRLKNTDENFEKEELSTESNSNDGDMEDGPGAMSIASHTWIWVSILLVSASLLGGGIEASVTRLWHCYSHGYHLFHSRPHQDACSDDLLERTLTDTFELSANGEHYGWTRLLSSVVVIAAALLLAFGCQIGLAPGWSLAGQAGLFAIGSVFILAALLIILPIPYGSIKPPKMSRPLSLYLDDEVLWEGLRRIACPSGAAVHGALSALPALYVVLLLDQRAGQQGSALSILGVACSLLGEGATLCSRRRLTTWLDSPGLVGLSLGSLALQLLLTYALDHGTALWLVAISWLLVGASQALIAISVRQNALMLATIRDQEREAWVSWCCGRCGTAVGALVWPVVAATKWEDGSLHRLLLPVACTAAALAVLVALVAILTRSRRAARRRVYHTLDLHGGAADQSDESDEEEDWLVKGARKEGLVL